MSPLLKSCIEHVYIEIYIEIILNLYIYKSIFKFVFMNRVQLCWHMTWHDAHTHDMTWCSWHNVRVKTRLWMCGAVVLGAVSQRHMTWGVSKTYDVVGGVSQRHMAWAVSQRHITWGVSQRHMAWGVSQRHMTSERDMWMSYISLSYMWYLSKTHDIWKRHVRHLSWHIKETHHIWYEREMSYLERDLYGSLNKYINI